MTYKQIKAKYKLTDEDFSKWFGYSTANVFRNSSKFKQVQSGIESFYKTIQEDKEVTKEDVKQNINEQINRI